MLQIPVPGQVKTVLKWFIVQWARVNCSVYSMSMSSVVLVYISSYNSIIFIRLYIYIIYVCTPTLETQTKAVRYKHNFPGQISSNRHQKRQTRKHAWKNLWENDGICQSTTWKAETWNHSFGGDPVASIRELDLEVLQQLQSIGGYAKRTEMLLHMLMLLKVPAQFLFNVFYLASL